MAIDITGQIDLSLQENGDVGNQAAFQTPHLNMITVVNNIANGTQALDKVLFTAASEIPISGDALTTTQAMHTVAAETGTADNLTTVNGVAAGQFVFLRAKAGHTITVKHAAANIALAGGADYALSGNRTLLLVNIGGTLADIAPISTPPASVPATNTLPNAGFEDWGNGTTVAPILPHWTKSGAGAVLARESTIVKQGTYSAKLSRVGADAFLTYDAFENEQLGGSKYIKTRSFTFGAWVYATVASRAQLYVDDGVTPAGSAFHTGSSSWEYLSTTINVSGSATKLECSLRIGSGNTDAYIDAASLVESSGALAANAVPSVILNRLPKRWNVWFPSMRAEVIGGNAFTAPSALTTVLGNAISFQSAPSANDEWTITTGVLGKGTYTLRMYGTTDTSYGRSDIYIDNELWGQFDWYSGSAVVNVAKTMSGTIKFDGIHRLTAKINGKNGSSSNYFLNISIIELVQSGD